MSSTSSLSDCDTSNATEIDWKGKIADYGKREFWPADFYLLRKKDYFEYLSKMNAGVQNGPSWYNKKYFAFRWRSELFHVVASRLSMTKPQVGRAGSWFEHLQCGNTGRRTELVAYCVCAYIVHNDRFGRKCHPSVPTEHRDEVFEETREDYQITMKEFRSVYGKLESIAQS